MLCSIAIVDKLAVTLLYTGDVDAKALPGALVDALEPHPFPHRYLSACFQTRQWLNEPSSQMVLKLLLGLISHLSSHTQTLLLSG